MAERCPICGGEILLGECSGCGFKPPDYSAIAAPYDLDPSNDRFGEADTVESMFPAIDTVEVPDSSALEIPSIALPNVPSANSLGRFASAGVQPVPNIRVRPAVQTVSPPKPVRTPQPVQPIQSAYGQQNFGQTASPFVRFVKGTANYAAANWWKFLIIAAAPTTGLFFAWYFGVKYKMNHRISDILTAILLGVISMGLMINGWDLFGLDSILQTVLSFIFGE